MALKDGLHHGKTDAGAIEILSVVYSWMRRRPAPKAGIPLPAIWRYGEGSLFQVHI